jgi:competence protein ComEA
MMGGNLLRRFSAYLRASPGELGALALAGALILSGSAFVYARTSHKTPTPVHHVSQPKLVAAEKKKLVVHVAGMVAVPGVYELPDGSRVKDAIAAAGGAAAGADIDALNLAALVQDGQKIVVPKPGESVDTKSGTSVGGKVNLNQASQAELEELPSVGPVLAGRIIQFRQSKGGFRSVRDLLQVEGFGPKKFEALKDLVTV